MITCDKKTAVCIITHDRINFLKDAINSVLCSDFDDYHLFVFNYNSTDGTNEYLASLNKKNILTEIRSENNLGSFGNANNVLKIMNAKYCLMLHDDDTIEPLFLKKTSNLIESDNRISMMGTGWNIIDEFGEIREKRIYSQFIYPVILKDKDYFYHHLKGLTFPWSGTLLRMEKAKELYFDNINYKYLADTVFLGKLAAGNNIGYIPEALMNYRISNKQISINISFEDQYELWRKNFNFYTEIILNNNFGKKFLNLHKKATTKTLFALLLKAPDFNYFFTILKSEYFKLYNLNFIEDIKIINKFRKLIFKKDNLFIRSLR